MKKVFKSKSNPKVTYTVDENLEKIKGKVIVSKKLEEINRLLRNLKTPLPK